MPDGMPISIPWYPSDDIYKEIAALAGSKHPMPYAEWISQIESFEEGFRNSGDMPVRIEIDAESLKAWCKAKGVPLERKSISQYAAEKMVGRFNRDN